MDIQNVKDFKENLITKKSDVTLFQCWSDKGLLKKVRAKRNREKLSWRNLIEALFKMYLKM